MFFYQSDIAFLSVLHYHENHTILFHWVCERAFRAKKVPSTNLQLPPKNRVPQMLYLTTCTIMCHLPEDQKCRSHAYKTILHA